VSQQLLGDIGDYIMAAITVLVVMMTTSAQIQSLSAITVYDVYQTYIYRFRPPSTISTTSASDAKDEEISKYLLYNRRCVFVRHFSTIFFSILTFPITVIFMAIEIDTEYKVLSVVLLTGSCILPVCLSVLWHRITGLGVVSGIVTGLAAGVAAWLVYAMTFPGGLSDFLTNTGRQEVMMTAIAVSFAVGGVICTMISLCCGGLSVDRDEYEEWDKCLKLDNPAKPWALLYADDSDDRSSDSLTETPSFKEV